MPWCPNCHSEYPLENSTCPECGTELVEQEPTNSRIQETTLPGIKRNRTYIFYIAIISFVAHISLILWPCIDRRVYGEAEGTAIVMLLISLHGLFMGLVIPSITISRAFIGSLLGAIPFSVWLIAMIELAWSDAVEFTGYLFVISATLAVVSFGANRLRKIHRLRHVMEVGILITILTGASYAIKYLYDMLIQQGI